MPIDGDIPRSIAATVVGGVDWRGRVVKKHREENVDLIYAHGGTAGVAGCGDR